jgi:hypothetical protein
VRSEDGKEVLRGVPDDVRGRDGGILVSGRGRRLTDHGPKIAHKAPHLAGSFSLAGGSANRGRLDATWANVGDPLANASALETRPRPGTSRF